MALCMAAAGNDRGFHRHVSNPEAIKHHSPPSSAAAGPGRLAVGAGACASERTQSKAVCSFVRLWSAGTIGLARPPPSFHQFTREEPFSSLLRPTIFDRFLLDSTGFRWISSRFQIISLARARSSRRESTSAVCRATAAPPTCSGR